MNFTAILPSNMSLNILLIDDHPHIQKSIEYFLCHLSPVIHKTNEKPKNLDIIFLDSSHIDENLNSFQKKGQKTPVVLLSRDIDLLRKHAQNPKHNAQLKKPIDPQKLRQMVSELVPQVKELKITPYLEFHDIEEKKGDFLSGLNYTSKKEEPKNLDSKLNLKLTDEEEITALHNTTTHFKKMSHRLKTPDEDSALRPLSDFLNSTEKKIQKDSEKNQTLDLSEISPTVAQQEVLVIKNPNQPLPPSPSEDSMEPPDSHEFLAPTEDPDSAFVQRKTHLLGHQISKLIDQKFKANWDSYLQDSLKKSSQKQISSSLIDERVKNVLKNELETIIIRTVKNVCKKTVPEISKQIIKKELQKRHD